MQHFKQSQNTSFAGWEMRSSNVMFEELHLSRSVVIILFSVSLRRVCVLECCLCKPFHHFKSNLPCKEMMWKLQRLLLPLLWRQSDARQNSTMTTWKKIPLPNAELVAKFNDLAQEINNKMEMHSANIREMASQNEKARELISFYEKSEKEHQKDSVEKERELQNQQNKIKELENQLRLETNKVKPAHKVSTRTLIRKAPFRFKSVEDQDSSDSETVEIEVVKKCDLRVRSTKLSLPQKRTGKPVNLSSSSVVPGHQIMENHADSSKKLKLMKSCKSFKENALGYRRNIEEIKKNYSKS